MIATRPIVDRAGRAAQTFIAEWRGSGAIQGLPRWLEVANDKGEPTGQFLQLARKAFSLTPSIQLRSDEVIIETDTTLDSFGWPTLAMQNAWAAWIS